MFDQLIKSKKIFNFYGVDNYYFKIDKYIFEVIEDPDDGYRSCLGDIRLADNTNDLIFFKTPIARVKILEINEENFSGHKLYDEIHKHTWLIFGTDESDSYYPSFIFYYQTLEEKFMNTLES